MMSLYQLSKMFDKFCIHLDTILERDGQTDGRTKMVNQDRAVSKLTRDKNVTVIQECWKNMK